MVTRTLASASPSRRKNWLCAGVGRWLAGSTYSSLCPSVNASSWNRPLLSTSQVSMYVTPPIIAGAGNGDACWMPN